MKSSNPEMLGFVYQRVLETLAIYGAVISHPVKKGDLYGATWNRVIESLVAEGRLVSDPEKLPERARRWRDTQAEPTLGIHCLETHQCA